jgi:hypothetical protein
VTIGHEIADFSVRIARDVLQRGLAGGTLVEPLQGHDGEQLVYGPRVWKALEEREIAEIFVG